jgi:FkbM family methyltransferase
MIKTAVTWPPLNHPVTSAVRAVLPTPARAHPFVARFLPRSGVVEAPLPDGRAFRMWSQGDDDIATTLFWRDWAGHEPETTTAFYQRAVSARTTLDIGAHVGYFALLAGLANPGGRVFAFEPLDRVRERLTRNVELNGLTNVQIRPVALGRGSGTAAFFHVPDGIPSSSSLSGEFMRSIIDTDRLVTSDVEVTTVDEFVAQEGLAGTVDLVKIDTEDTEDQVLEGMTKTLAGDRPAIFCEVLKDGTGQRIEEIVGRFDYELFLLTPDGPRRCERIRPDPRWRNFLMVPADRRP